MLHHGHLAPASACATRQRHPELFRKASSEDVCTDYEGHHTNTSMRDCLEHHAWALPIGHPPQELAPAAVVPALGSLNLGASAAHAPEVFTETFTPLVLLPLLRLDLRGLMIASKSLAFLRALWGLLSLRSSTESLVSTGSEMISPVLTACLGEASWSAEHKSLDEMKWCSVLLSLLKAMAFFCVIILLLMPGLQEHKQQPHRSTEILCPGSGTVIRRKAPSQLTRKKKVTFKNVLQEPYCWHPALTL